MNNKVCSTGIKKISHYSIGQLLHIIKFKTYKTPSLMKPLMLYLNTRGCESFLTN